MTQPVTQEEWDDHRAASRQSLPEALSDAAGLPDVLLSYQAKLLATTADCQFVVCEKSRRIGMTWGVGADAVLTSAAAKSAGGMDTLYIGFNLDMAREFIDVCAMWAKAFIPAASEVEETIFKDQSEDGQDKEILAFRIRFASGFEIMALTSKPRSLRGRQGYVIFDEAAFHDELGEMLKAAMALLMWGGKVLVISTHDGADNPFNELIQEVRSGKRDGKVVKVTFEDAVKDGLYDRIALVTGKDATEEAKQDWIAGIMGFYGSDADEELHCIPKAGTGAYISGAAVQACMSDEHSVARLTCPDGFELRPLPEREAFVQAFLDEHVGPVLAGLDPDRKSALGEDFARNSDLSVLAIGQERRDTSIAVPLLIEMKNTPIKQQQQVIKYVINRLPNFNAAKFDASGNGLGIAEWAQEEWGFDVVEAIKITASWWLNSGPILKQHVEDRTISLVNDADVKDDIRALRLIAGVPGLPSNRTKGRHGDAAVALIMMLLAMEADPEQFGYQSAGSEARSRYAAPDDDDDETSSDEGCW